MHFLPDYKRWYSFTPLIYYGLRTCYCKKILGKTSRKGFVETWWKRKKHAEILQASTHLPMSPHGCTSQCSLIPCAELVVAASMSVTLGTPCQHPHHAFVILILGLSQIQSAGTWLASSWHLGTYQNVTLSLNFLPADKKTGGCGDFQITPTFWTGDGEAELKSSAK